jgi:flagellar protein FliO/FliZ
MGNLGELSTPVQYFAVFLIVLAAIVLIFWVIRRFGRTAHGTAAVRGRQPRLAVIDAAAVDGRRRLLLIRRDNVEHLLMIGGPADIVVEQNIVRGSPATSSREAGPLRETMAEVTEGPVPGRETMIRPLGESGRIEPAMPRGADLGALRPEPAARSELSGRAERSAKSEPIQPPPPPPDIAQAARAPSSQPRSPDTPGRASPPFTVAPRAVPEPTVSAHARPAPPASDAELTDMAQRLEAALRRSAGPTPVRNEPTFGHPSPFSEKAPSSAPAASAAPAQPPAATGKTGTKPEPPRPVRSEPAPAPETDTKPKSVLDSLEQEMASLLGRPIGKE